MAFVLLPCDLPTWPTIEQLLQPLQNSAVKPSEFCAALQNLHSLCNINIDPGGCDEVPDAYFKPMEQLLTEEPALQDLLKTALPRMAKAALDLGKLKPPEGLSYSLQQQGDALVFSRAMISSLMAHTFFSTLPRRTVMSHPTLCNPIMASVLHELGSEDERVKVRAAFQYFALLHSMTDTDKGSVIIDRKVMGTDTFLRLRKWRESQQSLCRLKVTLDPLQKIPSRPCIVTCTCTAHPARAALLPHCIQDARGLEPHPELLVTGLLVEKLEDNEAVQVTGVVSPSSPSVSTPDDLTYALLDADDYSDNWILQYENINILRELNKSFLAFSSPITISKDRVIPTLPAGVVLDRPRYAGALSAASPDISLPSTPIALGSMDKTFELMDAAKDSVNKSTQNSVSEVSQGATQKVGTLSKGPQESQENNITSQNKTQDSSKKTPSSENNITNTTEQEDTNRKKSTDLDKRKLPKILELLLPKKNSTTAKAKSEGSNLKGGKSTAGAEEIKKEDESIFQTAFSTLKKQKNKKNMESKSESNKVKISEDCNIQSPKRVSFDKEKNQNATFPQDSTSDLLNRVLKAIQGLEKEQSALLKNVPPHKIVEQDLIPNTEDLYKKSIQNAKNKPPLPEKSKTNSRKTSRPNSGHFDKVDKDDTTVHNANESLDLSDETDKPRRKGGRRERLPKSRRKHSFAERLKEAMERGGSTDSTAHCDEPNADGGFLQNSGSANTGGNKAYFERDATLTAGSSKSSSRASQETRDPCSQTNEDKEDEAEHGSGSSRYSFSSDYSSELDEVYDHLEEVLHQLEGATPGPRTAAIAQLAHKLLKRAFSESSKGACAEVSDAEDSPDTASSRPRSMSDGALQGPPLDQGAATDQETKLQQQDSKTESPKSKTPPKQDVHFVTRLKKEEVKTTKTATVLTESWGCDELGGNRQLKAMIQWAAASMAGADHVVYCTHNHEELSELNIVSEVVSDLDWTVSQLTDAILKHCSSTLIKWRTNVAAGRMDRAASAACCNSVTLFEWLQQPPTS